ncbi:DUF6653 family protein [Brachybacterium sp. YJGR34]|uniref:DUF6653 family protein n=1 Tax=Brachybacterium sp. YJGR34 TaxID=2059911 RepID=UPI0018E64F60|nr:DUF6653 family protein [Brachybacterium sp. YJGR34]
MTHNDQAAPPDRAPAAPGEPAQPTAASAGESSLRRAVFARHSHPLSAWSRWASIPAILVPFWRRSWRPVTGLAAWFALNPVMTPPPAHRDAFATRAILGEERWLADRTLDPRMGAVNAAGSALLAAGAAAAWRRRALPAALAAGASMAATLYSWARYAAIEDRARAAGDAERS